MEVGQPHVCRVLGWRELVHRGNETVLVQVVQEAQHAEVGAHGDRELCL